MLALGIKLNVLNNHHLRARVLKHGSLDDVFARHVVANGVFKQSLCGALRRFHQSLTSGVFAYQFEDCLVVFGYLVD